MSFTLKCNPMRENTKHFKSFQTGLRIKGAEFKVDLNQIIKDPETIWVFAFLNLQKRSDFRRLAKQLKL